jgi:ABC-type glutathione transport system ATPase component
MSLITAENISVSLGQTPILKDINFSVETGETLAIVGETGCGKSLLCKTLLNILPQSLSVNGNMV